MTICVFGNEDLAEDCLPLKIVPKLREAFSTVSFKILDPNEEWDVSGDVTVIDTVVGIGRVTVFDDLAKFKSAPRLTMHDFDALANLRYLQKLGKIHRVTIIGIPVALSERVALVEVTTQIARLIKKPA